MLRVRPSMTSEMFWVVPTLRGSALYLLTSSSVQSRMEVHVNWEDTVLYFTVKPSEIQQLLTLWKHIFSLHFFHSSSTLQRLSVNLSLHQRFDSKEIEILCGHAAELSIKQTYLIKVTC